jgi:hypothetical protein
MNRKPLFSFGLSIVWICVCALQTVNFWTRILFERRHGVTELSTYAFLVFWIGMLAINIWGFWISRKGRRNGVQVD